MAERIWSDTARSAVSVKWFERKPCWDEEKRWFAGHVEVKLSLNNFFYYFWEGWDDGDGTEF